MQVCVLLSVTRIQSIISQFISLISILIALVSVEKNLPIFVCVSLGVVKLLCQNLYSLFITKFVTSNVTGDCTVCVRILDNSYWTVSQEACYGDWHSTWLSPVSSQVPGLFFKIAYVTFRMIHKLFYNLVLYNLQKSLVKLTVIQYLIIK